MGFRQPPLLWATIWGCNPPLIMVNETKGSQVLSHSSVGSHTQIWRGRCEADSFIRPDIKRLSSPSSRVSYNFIDLVYKDDTEHISLQRQGRGLFSSTIWPFWRKDLDMIPSSDIDVPEMLWKWKWNALLIILFILIIYLKRKSYPCIKCAMF